MLFGDRGLDHAFDPLKVVDVKTMSAIADSLKKSNDRGKKAVGVFLDRVNRLRIADSEHPESRSSPTGADTRTGARPAARPVVQGLSGLRDLQE